jgi:hypothetical protein
VEIKKTNKEKICPVAAMTKASLQSQKEANKLSKFISLFIWNVINFQGNVQICKEGLYTGGFDSSIYGTET